MSTSSLVSNAEADGAARAALRPSRDARAMPRPSWGIWRSTLEKRHRMTNPKTTAKPDRGRPDRQTVDHLDRLERTCPNCGAHLEEHKCELKCPTCNYFKSCSDY